MFFLVSYERAISNSLTWNHLQDYINKTNECAFKIEFLYIKGIEKFSGSPLTGNYAK